MAWSTRELAELAGTTVNTVRHYHRLGLLEHPQRRPSGYKEYGADHLICLLHIRRLVELGVPLSQIVALGPDDALGPEVLRQVDAGHLAEIERLQKARSDIAVILRGGTCDASLTHVVDPGRERKKARRAVPGRHRGKDLSRTPEAIPASPTSGFSASRT
ncbi:MerR family transcriptional regulator [Micromonospora sp. BQ11]|uniref:MerR family transcriptional regulator n=1 Tax=Micromonospora sp. BQ11 TaxID=3452212 RepID=UPI003F8AB18E